MKKDKVYGGTAFIKSIQKRIIVRACTKKEALELLNKKVDVSIYHFNNFWCETLNDTELEICKLGEVWSQDSSYSKNYTKLN